MAPSPVKLKKTAHLSRWGNFGFLGGPEDLALVSPLGEFLMILNWDRPIFWKRITCSGNSFHLTI